MRTWNWKTRNWTRLGTCLLALALLAACQSDPALTPEDAAPPGLTLSQERAAAGEEVRVTLRGLDADHARVYVGGVEAVVEAVEGNTLTFVVPKGIDEGSQVVEVRADGLKAQGLLGTLGGGTVPGEIALIVEPGTRVSEVLHLLDPLGLLGVRVIEGPRPLGGDEGPCSGELIVLDVGKAPLGGVLEALTGGPVWYSDPTSDYSPGGTDGSIDAPTAYSENQDNQGGAGTVIAVLDTGVSPHEELGPRLLSSQGYDFVDEDADAADAYQDAGHGTPIAVLAAGATLGVAPQAQVLPVKVCGGNGGCYTTDITLGLCYALSKAESELGGMENLVLNLSFGGATPNTAIRAILEYAIANDALVAAAGGNEGQEGSPPNYPAAADLDGMVAVAALESAGPSGREGSWRPAAFSSRGDYLDISAPGTDLESGTSSGGYSSSYSGTSFATALTSGALALWRGAEPGMGAAEVEAGLKAAAEPLDYPENVVGAGMLALPEPLD